MNKDFENWIKEQEEKQTPEEKEEIRLKLIRTAISSKQGWKSLAQSVVSAIAHGTSDAKEKCVSLLRKIAGDHEVDMPAVPLKEGEMGEDSSDTAVEMVKVKFADLLVQQLEHHLEELDKEKE